MQKKSCSKCNTQVYVACRSCPTCKQSFPKTGPIALIMSEYEGLYRRRTERIKRDKPNYYDASVFSNRKNVPTPKKPNNKKSEQNQEKEKPAKKSSATRSSSPSSKKEKESTSSQSLAIPKELTREEQTSSVEASPVQTRRKKLMKARVSKDTEEETYNAIINNHQSSAQCGSILAELNRRLFSTSWRGL